MNRILVLYGTTDGHTAMIAQTIGDTLKAAGFGADVIRAGTVDPRPADYDGIVVAASVQAGGYQKAVGRWVAAHVKEFGSRPTAFVSACLGVLQKDPKVDAELDAIAARFLDAAGWRPTVRKVVAGALLYTQYGFFKRWIMKRIVAKAGGETDTSRDYDYTDWNDVREFARSFGRRVAAAAAA